MGLCLKQIKHENHLPETNPVFHPPYPLVARQSQESNMEETKAVADRCLPFCPKTLAHSRWIDELKKLRAGEVAVQGPGY